MTEYLNLAEIALNIQTLGPGRRIVVWVQGCQKRCPGCISPEFRDIRPEYIMKIKSLVDLIVKNASEHDGLTFSGGEPLLQASGLLSLWQSVKFHLPHWNLILFSGYSEKQIANEHDRSSFSLLQSCDAFIGGPFLHLESEPCSGLRGSRNQEIFFPKTTSFNEAEQDKICHFPNAQQLCISEKSILLAGIPVH